MVKSWKIESIRSQAPKSVMSGYGEGSETKWLWARELDKLNERLRYSPVPPERVLNQTFRCNDFRRKCLNELVVRERDCMIAHGTSRFLQERLYDASDKYSIGICESCGNFATDKHHCVACEEDCVSEVKIPYVSKLVVHQLNAMLIKTKIKAEE
jgi:hypothetical protein